MSSDTYYIIELDRGDDRCQLWHTNPGSFAEPFLTSDLDDPDTRVSSPEMAYLFYLLVAERSADLGGKARIWRSTPDERDPSGQRRRYSRV